VNLHEVEFLGREIDKPVGTDDVLSERLCPILEWVREGVAVEAKLSVDVMAVEEMSLVTPKNDALHALWSFWAGYEGELDRYWAPERVYLAIDKDPFVSNKL
jgi:hypothetical protein